MIDISSISRPAGDGRSDFHNLNEKRVNPQFRQNKCIYLKLVNIGRLIHGIFGIKVSMKETGIWESQIQEL